MQLSDETSKLPPDGKRHACQFSATQNFEPQQFKTLRGNALCSSPWGIKIVNLLPNNLSFFMLLKIYVYI